MKRLATPSFTITKTTRASRARLGVLRTPHGVVHTPAYVIVATHAQVKTLTPADIRRTKTQLVIANTYHLWGKRAAHRTLSMPDKIIELNREMYRSNSRLTATHPYSSTWYSWPLMERPIFYWVKDSARIYLLGNPIVWWLSTAAVMILLMNLVGTGLRNLQTTPLILLGAWLMNMLPFMGINRVMFLYHYFTALIWAILMLAYAADQSGKVREAFFTIGALAFALFLFFAPLSYGLPLSSSAYNARAWFASWR